MEKDELKKFLEAEKKKIKKLDGFTLCYYAGQALDDLKDANLAQAFLEVSETFVGTEEQAHPCDIGKMIYKVYGDKERAVRAYETSLRATGWDAADIKSTEKDWAKISKAFK